MSITATLVVNFGGGAGVSTLIAELDDIRNSEKITFLPSETAFFALYSYPSTLVIGDPVPTSGMVISAGSVTRTKTETLQFVGTQSVELAYPPSGEVTVTQWYGNQGQDFAINGFTATISSDEPCICDVSYSTTGSLWELFPPIIDTDSTPNWPIIVFITGEDA